MIVMAHVLLTRFLKPLCTECPKGRQGLVTAAAHEVIVLAMNADFPESMMWHIRGRNQERIRGAICFSYDRIRHRADIGATSTSPTHLGRSIPACVEASGWTRCAAVRRQARSHPGHSGIESIKVPKWPRNTRSMAQLSSAPSRISARAASLSAYSRATLIRILACSISATMCSW